MNPAPTALRISLVGPSSPAIIDLSLRLAAAGVYSEQLSGIEEALTAWEHNPPDLFLVCLDPNAPETRQFISLRSARANLDLPPVPALLLPSAETASPDGHRAPPGLDGSFPVWLETSAWRAWIEQFIASCHARLPVILVVDADDQRRAGWLQAFPGGRLDGSWQVCATLGEGALDADIDVVVMCEPNEATLRHVTGRPKLLIVATIPDGSPPGARRAWLARGAHDCIFLPDSAAALRGEINRIHRNASPGHVTPVVTRELTQRWQECAAGAFRACEQPLLLLDPAGRLEMWNEPAAELLAILGATAPAKDEPLTRFLSPSLRPAVEQAITALSTQPDQRREVALIGPTQQLLRLVFSRSAGPEKHATSSIWLMVRQSFGAPTTDTELSWHGPAWQAMTHGVLVTDARGRILYANTHFETLTGWSTSELLGRTCKLMQGPGTSPAQVQFIRRELDAGRACQVEILNYRRDGSTFWNDLTISPVRDAATGEIVRFVGIQNDITARKSAELQLTESQRRLRAIFDHSLDGITLLGDDGGILDANPAALELFDLPFEDLQQQRIFDLFQLDASATGHKAWKRFLADRLRHGETTLRRSSGASIEIEFEAAAFIQANLHLVIFRDITERKTLQNHRLRQQRMESVGRLASGVAHDLNNILTPILMAPAMLRARVTDPASRALLATIEDGARRGAGIVRHLLDFARAQPGEVTLNDLQTITRGAIDVFRDNSTFQPVINAPGFAGELPVMANAPQLQQAIVHLILNAYEASVSKKAEITILCQNRQLSESDLLRYPQARAGDYVCVTVGDKGAGIDPDVQERIFEPFYSTKGFGNGRGLGLSVVLGIVHSHDGFTEIRSKPSLGTVATIWLPRYRAEAVESAGAGSPAPAKSDPPQIRPGAGRFAVVIDDEESMRQLARTVLEYQGFRVATAGDADQALTVLNAHATELSLVLVDLRLPGAFGTKLILTIRQRYPQAPIVTITGSILRESESRELRAKAVEVLQKPFTHEQLQVSIAEAERRLATALAGDAI